MEEKDKGGNDLLSVAKSTVVGVEADPKWRRANTVISTFLTTHNKMLLKRLPLPSHLEPLVALLGELTP